MTSEYPKNLYAEAVAQVLDDWGQECEDAFPYTSPRAALTFNTHSEVRRALAEAGSHFYDRDAIRWFNARTSDNYMMAQRFWIESKRFEDDPRIYQIAWISRYGGPDGGGNALSVERSREFPSLAAARKARKILADAVRALEDKTWHTLGDSSVDEGGVKVYHTHKG